MTKSVWDARGRTNRWVNADVARRYDVPEDVVRRIYKAVQTAKKQGLHGGHYVDFVERVVGRKLRGGEFDVSARAKKHLGYDPPGGYQGPKPRGSAREPLREVDERRIAEARKLVSDANRVIEDAINRRQRGHAWDDATMRVLLSRAADDLDVAADAYEAAGPRLAVLAGTLRERGRLARAMDLERLAYYGA